MKLDNLPLVSVIVPIYKIERYIGLCIESLINQDYKNLEILLVDDGSPDRCPEICDLYAEKDNRIKVIHKENGGLVSARKAGLEASHGEYIANVDGDDWIGEDFISALMEAILISDADAAVAGQERVFFGQTKRLLNVLPFGVYQGEKLENFFKEMISTSDFYDLGIFTYVWNKIFRREVIYPALMNCKKVVVTTNTSYHYRQREDSMLKKSSPFATEAPSIKILHDYMMDRIGQKVGIERQTAQRMTKQMAQQIQDYILSIFIIRSGGILPTKRANSFPFGVNIQGKKVAIYSAGTFGQQLRLRLKESGYCEVVGWFDDDYWEYRRCCLDVDPVTNVKKVDFDYLLVAAINADSGRKIAENIANMGIPRGKILSIDCTGGKENALNQYMDFADKCMRDGL